MHGTLEADLAIETPAQALVLASIIEKKAMHQRQTSDQSGLSSEIEKNMKLQTDPTVIYALGRALTVILDVVICVLTHRLTPSL